MPRAKSRLEESEVSPQWFADPPFQYRPAVAVRVGPKAPEDIEAQIAPILIDRGFGGLMLFPHEPKPADPTTTRDPTIQRVIRAARQIRSQSTEPPEPPPEVDVPVEGHAPPYLSDEYFVRYERFLRHLKRLGRTAVLYDEAGYPSGGAGGGKIDPANYRKLLTRTEYRTPPGEHTFSAPDGVLLAAVAMHQKTKVRIDLTPRVRRGSLTWRVPSRSWKVSFFSRVTSIPQGGAQDYHAVIDYFDPNAVHQFIDVTYEAYARHVGKYFGNTITMTFFDDVGIYPAERTWGAGIETRFRARFGRKPHAYYPALWEDIGPETAPARIAFFNARAEALAAGFPRLVSAWTAQHGLKASGHAPGQYDLQPTDMNGDPFKFYAAQPIPMIDVIFRYGFGRDGFKLTTSAADCGDKAIVAAEQFTTSGTVKGYKRAMDSLVRGVNTLITGSTSEIGRPKAFAEWAGRACMLLQGGRRVADIAIVYPIASLQAFYRFEAEDNREGPVGHYAPASADYLDIGDKLTCDLHRDFTFLHPDDLAGPHLKVQNGGRLILDNATNRQTYRLLILPGGDVLSLKTMQKIRCYYDAGGKVIATTRLPSRSAEPGRDKELKAVVRAVFGRATGSHRNARGGDALFVRKPTTDNLRKAIEKLGVAPDAAFENDPAPRSGGGALAYIHKVKGGKEIWFIANSSDDRIDTSIYLRGTFKAEIRDPHSGTVTETASRSVTRSGTTYTALPLALSASRSVFVVAEALS